MNLTQQSLKIKTLYNYAFKHIYINKQLHKHSKALTFIFNAGIHFCSSCAAIPVFPKHAFHPKSTICSQSKM